MAGDARWDVTPRDLDMTPAQAARIEAFMYLFRTLDLEGARYADVHYQSAASRWYHYCIAALARRA